MNSIILDCEASGLDTFKSYPIQIAWIGLNSDNYDTFYIKPHHDWNYWDVEAELVHNIPRKLLYDVGLSINASAIRLLNSLHKFNIKTIYSDSPFYDGNWFYKLFKYAGYFDIEYEFEHIANAFDNEKMKAFYIQETLSQKRPHDALEDCKMMKEAYHNSVDKFNSSLYF